MLVVGIKTAGLMGAPRALEGGPADSQQSRGVMGTTAGFKGIKTAGLLGAPRARGEVSGTSTGNVGSATSIGTAGPEEASGAGRASKRVGVGDPQRATAAAGVLAAVGRAGLVQATMVPKGALVFRMIARELGFVNPEPTQTCADANAVLLGVKRKKESKAMRYVAGRYVAGHYAMLRAAVEGGGASARVAPRSHHTVDRLAPRSRSRGGARGEPPTVQTW
jgi:hypothetical protein